MKHISPLFTSARLSFAVLLSSLALLLCATGVQAATITVTTINDSGAGSLRQAIADAAPGDTITFAVTGTIILTSGELAFNKDLSIQGPGANLLTISGNNASRVFQITGGAVGLSGLSISNGNFATEFGGGIRATGCNLTISNCAITSNKARNAGGLFLARGTFSLTNTTISGNVTESQASGVNFQNVTATMTNCTISNNTSQLRNGGILNVSSVGNSTVLLDSCTITNNTSQASFGTIWTAVISTSASDAKATTTLRNTLAANNGPPNFIFTGRPNAVLTSLGNNLDSDGTSGFINGTNGDLVGTAANPLNALLGPLANNGGPAQTHALLPGSPAIDKGANANLPTDQRGFTRLIDDPVIANATGGDGTDIGAFEVGATAVPIGDLTICFADASRWCNRLTFLSGARTFAVVVPGVNFNQPLPVFVQGDLNPLVRSYLGCGGYMRMDVTSQLIAAYVSAQLSLQEQVPFWWGKINRQALFFHVRTPMGMPGMPAPPRALPATFGGGPVISLTDFSSLQDLFDATNWTVTKGTLTDQQTLLAIYAQLNNCVKD